MRRSSHERERHSSCIYICCKHFGTQFCQFRKIMTFGFVCFYILLNFLSSICWGHEECFGELCFVGIVFRHGDRAPLGPYPKDPHHDVSCWPNGWGQMTKLGKHQQYELGKWIRHNYWDFLPLAYNSSDIHVCSTDVDRALVSAMCNLAGLYESWHAAESDGSGWQSIPVHTVPLELDEVLAGHKHCPAYDCLFANLMNFEEVKQMNDFYQEMFCNLSQHTGLKIRSLVDCPSLHGTLYIQKLHGLQLPRWTQNYFPEPLQEISEFAFRLPCYTVPLKRLKCGPLLKDIIRHMEDKKEGKITQKIWLYSGHDSTLANLMQCLDVFDGELPPYTATLMLELYKADKEYFVVVSYKTPTTFRILRLPCCDRVCPFDSFKKILQPVLPVDWTKECLQTCKS